MRVSQMFLPTLKEVPSDAEVISHIMMLRAGMIRKQASGIYSYLPLGLRAIRRVEEIIREEMNRAGAQELLLPALQPSELWQESGRWDFYGKELLRFKDRHDRDFCLGPTHEEVITDLVRREIKSYRQLPINLYQIQTKFRDEIRPRFGIMRSREFGMKDAYSFDIDFKGAEESYRKMYDSYTRIFSRCGLNFKAVEADTGNIGGSFSHEFMVLADTGEDLILSCGSCDYAANAERAEIAAPQGELPAERDFKELEKVHTPDAHTVEEVTKFLGISPEELVKTMIVDTDKGFVAALVRGDLEINPIKVKNLLGCEWCYLASERYVEDITSAPTGFAGPVGLKIKVIADNSIKLMKNFVVGANDKDMHYINANYVRDFEVHEFADLSQAAAGAACPRCGGIMEEFRGIEVGHIFMLGNKYSHSLGAVYLDEDGKEQEIVMGCYGIGVGRTVAAAIEQNHDEDGIIFPMPLAPFQVIVLPVNVNDHLIRETSFSIYNDLLKEGVDAVIDDRDERAGVKFKDADLCGFPLRVTVGSRGLKENKVEIKKRAGSKPDLVPLDEAVFLLKQEIDRQIEKLNSLT
jgi:prolyl-tRNA synthetase